MRILVCGGRDYKDRERVFKVLDGLHCLSKVTEVIQGGARGADTLAKEWALKNEVPQIEVKADWEKHGLSAGPIRNVEMIKYSPRMVIAFPGGRGTEHMVSTARKYNIPVQVISRDYVDAPLNIN